MRLPVLSAVVLGIAVGITAMPARAEPSRWIALIPFGGGQFQNGDTRLGIFFAASEVLFATTSVASYLYVQNLASSTPAPMQAAAINERLATSTAVNRGAFACWAGMTLAGIIEAQVNFGPKPAAVTTTAMPGGATFGLRAAF
jgi:hypothetical protein